MNIVHVLWSLGTGGTETMLADIASEQSVCNNVSIIVVNDIVDKRVLARISDRCKVYFCKRKRKSKNPLPLIRLNYLLWKLSPHIIHAHMDNLGKYLKLTGKAKIVRTVHCAMGDGSDNGYYDQLFAISEGVKKYILSQGYDSRVVYNGIHPELISMSPQNRVSENVVKIVNVGRLQVVKGQHLLIEAAHVLAKKGINNFHIDFIGDGENRQFLERMVCDYNLESKISIVGAKPREFVYLNLCNYDLYIQPSLSEGFGLTLSEAMSAGVPVLTSDQEGPLEVIDYGKYGLYFKTGNVMDLVEKIELFIKRGGQIDVTAARDFVKKHFDVQNTAQNYLMEYQKLIAER